MRLSWSRSLRSYAAALSVACLLLVGSTAVASGAAEQVDEFVALPFSSYGDMLVDPRHGQVFVTGGSASDQVAVVALDGSGVTMIPDMPGAAAMSMTQDGGHVYVGLRNAAAVAEIDTTTLAVRRLPTGPGSCPRQLAAVAGYVWFAKGCIAPNEIRRLDPVTGRVDPDIKVGGSLNLPVLRAIPGSTRFMYAETSSTRPRVGVYDVADGQLTLVSTGNLTFWLTENLQVTNDGGHFMYSNYGTVNFRRLTDFASDGVNGFDADRWATAFAATDQVVAAGLNGSSQVLVMRRRGDELLNTVHLGPDSASGEVAELELVGDTLYALTRQDGELRLFRIDRPSLPAPDLSLDTPTEVTVRTPVTLSGRLTLRGAPVDGAVVTLRQAGVDQPLASPTTDVDGRYSFEFVPQRPGELILSAHYAGDAQNKPVTARRVMSVVGTPVTLTLDGPSAVWPDEGLTLTGALFEDTAPMAGVNLRVQRRCPAAPWEDVGAVTTDASGAFSVRDIPGSCSTYEYVARYDGDSDHAPTSALVMVDVTWTEPTIDLQVPRSAHVGDAITIAGTVDTQEGPLADAPLTVRVETPSGTRDLGTVTTDATGWFETSDQPQVAGSHCYRVEYAGNPRTQAASAGRCAGVTKWATSLTLTGPRGAMLDDPVTLEGQLTSTGQPLQGAELRVTRTDGYIGAEELPTVVTGADGRFIIRDVPPNAGDVTHGGDVTYAVSYTGTAAREAAKASWAVAVDRPAPTLTLRTDRLTYDYGQTAEIGVELATESLRTVQVYAQESGAERTLIFSGEVPETGVTLQRVMRRNTVFSAEIPPGGRAKGAFDAKVRPTRAGMSTRAMGGYGASGSYKLYRPAADPRFAATVKPTKHEGCVNFQVQRRYSDGWRTVKTSRCVAIADVSTATWTFPGTQPTRTPYRVRPSYAGDDVNASKTSSWVYFKFV